MCKSEIMVVHITDTAKCWNCSMKLLKKSKEYQKQKKEQITRL